MLEDFTKIMILFRQQIGRSKDSFIDFYFTKPFNLKKNEFHSQPGSSNNLNADGELQDGSVYYILLLYRYGCGFLLYFRFKGTNTSYTNEDGDLRRRCQNNSETEEEVFDRICRYACQISVRLSEIVDPDGSIRYSRETKIFAGGIDSRNTFRLGVLFLIGFIFTMINLELLFARIQTESGTRKTVCQD